MQPLVSIPVITYNSSSTIIETLDSIYALTYPNIELIISDDCSKDNTLELCEQWIEEHKERFSRAEIIKVEKNTGVAGNQNRAIEQCRGEYALPVAGDDMVFPGSVEDGLVYMASHPDVPIVFGRMEGFGRSKKDVDEYMNRCYDYSFFDLSAEEQYHRLLFKGNCVPAPASFYNLELVRKLQIRNDGRIPMVEDYPKWMNITKRGIQLRFIEKVLVRYRLSDNSISTTTTPSLRAKQSSALIYIYYKFKPRFKYYKSPIKKLGEVRKYIHAANTAWGGWFWQSMKGVDWCLASVLNLFGAKLKV